MKLKIDNVSGRQIPHLRAVALLVAFLILPALGSAQKISISMKSVKVKDAITNICQSSNYSIAVKSEDIDMDRLCSVQAKDADIREVLDQVFAGQSVQYAISGKSISVTKTPAPSQQNINAKSRVGEHLTGIVTDEKGVPLVGAIVAGDDGITGTTTNEKGEFSLPNVKLPVTLKCTYLGYSSAQITATAYNYLKVVLKEEVNLMDQVVVIGYGTQRRANLTGAVGTISGKDINNRPVTNAASALQGADPSIHLAMTNGSIEGKNFTIDVRGSASINSGTPLVLVDGVEASLVQVNPNDIESVSVLKDASSSAIYGAKASSGVILITTKNAQEGKLRVNFNSRYGVSSNTTSTDFIHMGYDYVTLTNEFTLPAKGFAGWKYTDEEMQMLLDRRGDTSENSERPWVYTNEKGMYRYVGNFDWYGYLYRRKRPESEYNISLTGGTEKLNFYASGRYLSRDGLFNNNAADHFNGISFRTKVSAEVTKWLHYSNNISFEKTDYKYGGYWEQDGSEGLNSTGIITSMQNNISPTIVPVNPDGTTVMYSNGIQFANSPIGSGRGGVFADGRNSNRRGNNYFYITNKLVFDLLDGLKLNVDYTYRRRDKLGTYRSLPVANTWNNKQTSVVDFSNGSIYDFYQEDRFYYNGQVLNGFLSYDKTFDKRHHVSAVAGTNYEDYHQSTLSVRQKGSLSNSLAYINMDAAELIERAVNSNSAYRTLGYFGRVNYDYKGKYLFEASARYDGTSRFPKGDRWGLFPSASAGWRISEEPFWENVSPYVNNAKLRFSYGSLGNQQVSNYYYIETISTGSMGYTFDGLEKASYASASNPVSNSLTWETVTTYNLGLDLGFLDNRLNLTADFYIRDTKDMLAPSLTLPDVYGASSPKTNSADMRTRGYELVLSWNDRFQLGGKPFNYGVTASLGDYTSKITRYNNPDKLISDYYEGMTLGEIWGYKTDGLFKTDYEAAQYQAKYDDTAVNYRVYSCSIDGKLLAGDVKFVDLDGNNIISSGAGTVADSGDQRILGNSLPRYSYSLRLNGNWNGIDLSVFFQGVGKLDWMPHYQCYDFWGPYSFPTISFIPTDFESRCWSEDNRNAYFPRRRGYETYSAGSLYVNTDRYLQNAAYLRLKNVQVGYTLPLWKKSVEKIRFYFSGENLWYWSPIKRYSTAVDPERAMGSSSSGDNSYAYSKTLSVGIDITF